MIRGVDTTFLVAAEVFGHPGHSAARALLGKLVGDGDLLAMAPQVIAEFAHVVSDPRRFARPLEMPAALERASMWWNAVETKQVFPDAGSVALFTDWMATARLGRKRILDTMLAATYASNGVRAIITSNSRDFEAFNTFEIIVP